MKSLVLVVLLAVWASAADRQERAANPGDNWVLSPVPYARSSPVVRYVQQRPSVVFHKVPAVHRVPVVSHHAPALVSYGHHDDDFDFFDRKKRSAASPAEEHQASRQKRKADWVDDDHYGVLFGRPAITPVVYSRPVVRVQPVVRHVVARPYAHPGHIVFGHGFYDDK